MPKITLKTTTAAGLPLETTRTVENLRDAQKLFAAHATQIKAAFRLFPSISAAKIGSITSSKK